MPVFQKDSEVFDAVTSLQAAVERLNEKTGLAEEDRKAAEAEKKAAEEMEKKAAEEAEAEAKKTAEEQPAAEMAKVATTPTPEPPKTEEKPSGRGSR